MLTGELFLKLFYHVKNNRADCVVRQDTKKPASKICLMQVGKFPALVKTFGINGTAAVI